MNEAQTRKDLIDKAIEAAGWTAENGCEVLVEQSAREFAPERWHRGCGPAVQRPRGGDASGTMPCRHFIPNFATMPKIGERNARKEDE